MTKKPDRFERAVEACHFNDRSDALDAIKLLRREHAWVERMIKVQMHKAVLVESYSKVGQCQFILDQLKERRK